MTITITAFANSPDEGQGMARDMQVRWALEEVGLPYAVRLVSFDEMVQPAHLARQPFGQIPTYEDGTVTLFETGAINLHIGLNHPGLLPDDPAARARAITWMFAAQATVEPPIVELEASSFADPDTPWRAEHEAIVTARIRKRLDALSARLGSADWLEADGFSAGDLAMVGVLRRVEDTGILDDYPTLQAYIDRATARPAFRRAFAAQRAVFEAAQTKD